MPTPPVLEYAFTLHVDLAPPQSFGTTHAGQRRFIPITGGTFSGPRLSGTILPGGGDWNAVRPDGVVHVFAKYTIRVDSPSGTTNGEEETLISVTNEGYGRASQETMQVVFGENPAAAHTASGQGEEGERTKEWYTRTWPRFEVAGNSPHAWLNRSCFLGDLLPPEVPNHVKIDVYEVL